MVHPNGSDVVQRHKRIELPISYLVDTMDGRVKTDVNVRVDDG